MDPQTFELLSPSRFISFTFPNPVHDLITTASSSSHPLLRVAVLDSPISPPSHPTTAAMLVPINRQDDWIFSTEAGHLHLLLSSSPSLSRLILIGDPPSGSDPKPYTRPPSNPDPDPLTQFHRTLLPLLLALSPKSAFYNGIPQVPFITYDDGGDVARIVPVDLLVGPTVGEMLVEDVEFVDGERRRRLRFKRSPNLVQSQVRLLDDHSRPEAGSLLQPYLGPMVAGLSLWAPRSRSPPPSALCLGVGGGDLLMCLSHRLGFSVVGIEADEVVLSAAKRHFGLIEGESLKIVVGDAIELLGEISGCFDVIMVDLDSSDALNGVSAPPLEFVSKSVLLSARSALDDGGIMIVNVISPDECSYEGLVDCFRDVFAELYEIDVGNGENCVVVAAAAPVGSVESEEKERLGEVLKKVGVERFVGCIRKI